MIIHGAINYDQTGRRKKRSAGRKPARNRITSSGESIPSYTYRSSRADSCKSLSTSGCHTTVDPNAKVKQEVSSNYTVAVAYNKGAYQVIPKDGIKHIGR